MKKIVWLCFGLIGFVFEILVLIWEYAHLFSGQIYFEGYWILLWFTLLFIVQIYFFVKKNKNWILVMVGFIISAYAFVYNVFLSLN